MADCQQANILSLSTTVATVAQAQALAEALLTRRLAACVQVEPGLQSHYRWEGRLCAEPEVRLTIKTLPACKDAIVDLLTRDHPYQLPQLLWHGWESSQAYLDWVRGEVDVPVG